MTESAKSEEDDGEIENVDPVDPVDPVGPVDPATLGATFESTEDSVTVEFGENETANLAIITNTDPGRALASGGDGADTFDVAVKNISSDPDAEIFAQIEDFDLDENILSVGSFNSDSTVQDIRILKDDEGLYTDVEVVFDFDRVMTVRLMETTGVTAEHILPR